MKYLSIAALVAVGAIMMGCNKLDIVTEQTQQEEEPVISNTVTLTTTVSLDAATKALTSGGVKTFAVAEQMALVYKNTSGTTVKAVSAALTAGDIASGSKSATFTFELTDPDRSENVTYIYPAAMANSDGTVNYDALATQNGTLATLSSSLDLATKTSAWNAGSLPAATLENQLAILALTLKNSTGSSDITSSITGLTLSDGTKTYNVTREAVAGPIYVAIYPTADATIMVTATDGTKNYTKTLTGKTYAKGNGYSVSWKMVTAYTLAESTVGMIVGTDGKAYAAADKGNLPTGVTAVAMVAYKSATAGSSLAIALADEGEMDWEMAKSTCEGKTAVTGGTWKLPSQDEWKQMFGANGGNEESYTGLNTAITTAGGTALQEYGRYWSSSEDEGGDALRVNLYDTAEWMNSLKDEMFLVRACLAF